MRTLIIAEAGVNHNGSIDIARSLIDAAVEAKADIIKFQTFRSEKLVSETAPKADYQNKSTDAGESQLAMLKKLELSAEDHYVLQDYCRQKGIEFMSTPFDDESLYFLTNDIRVHRLKISSGEITNAPFLLKVAASHTPVILSTGMSMMGEIESALSALAFGYINNGEQPSVAAFQDAYASEHGQRLLKENVMLLHCTTEYPAPLNEVNLKAMDTMRQCFGLEVGYSDHTEGIAVSIAAVARGAVIIEKHFTLDRSMPGPDHKASLEPGELAQMVRAIREVEEALGQSTKYPTISEKANRNVARKSLVAAVDIPKGQVLDSSHITVKRPGSGISPYRYWDVIGTVAARDYRKDELL